MVLPQSAWVDLRCLLAKNLVPEIWILTFRDVFNFPDMWRVQFLVSDTVGQDASRMLLLVSIQDFESFEQLTLR